MEPVKFTDDITKRRYLPMELSDRNYVILWTNRVRCTLNTNIFYLLNEKVFLEKAVLEPVYKFDKKSYRECLKR